MMLGIGVLEVLVLLLVGGFVIALILGSGRRARSGSEGGGFSLGHAKLACPHCQQETTAGKPRCEHCGKDL